MKPVNRYINYAFIVMLLVLQAVLVVWWVLGYADELFNIQNSGESSHRYSPEIIEQLKTTYWVDLFEVSLVLFIVPLTIALFRLKYDTKKWLNVLYYLTLAFYALLFIRVIYVVV